ncbi:hypothetical protein BOX15_Mlig001518g4, partial [Macrostomum lignano]
ILKMSLFLQAAITCLILSSVLSPCLAIKCYLCNSTIQSDCLEEFNYNSRSIVPMDCDVADGKFCIKTTGVWGAVVGTTRFCSSMDMGNQCQYLPFPDHDRIYRACVYTCSSDACNAGSPSGGGGGFTTLQLLTSLTLWLLAGSRLRLL